MVISHNLVAYNAQRQFKMNTNEKQKISEKLSSGYRINRAADDAAGLSISEKMRNQIRGLNRAAENVRDGMSYVQVADGALSEVDTMLGRMRELAVQSSNDTNSEDDRGMIDLEVQQLKEEVDRIFENTEYNAIKIWRDNVNDVSQIGTKQVSVANIPINNQSFNITNENKDIFPATSITMSVSPDKNISASWTGANGTTYTTNGISLDDFKANGYQVELSSLFDRNNNPELFDTNGNPLFQRVYKINPSASDIPDDNLVDYINGTNINLSYTDSMTNVFKDAQGNDISCSGVSVRTSLNYSAVYASDVNLDHSAANTEADTFYEPYNNTANVTNIPAGDNVSAAQNSNDKWQIKFNVANIGEVVAESSEIGYYVNNADASGEGLWWKWITASDGSRYMSTIHKNISGGTLGNFMDALTGDRDSGSPGILTNDNGGANVQNFVSAQGKIGTVTINFGLTANNAFAYGTNNSNTNIGNMYIDVNIYKNDTEETVLNRLKSAINSNTIIDAVDKVSEQRAIFGATQNRLEAAYNANCNTAENTQSAELLIRDTDMAECMVEFSKYDILLQASQAMLAQANQTLEDVLRLLQ